MGLSRAACRVKAHKPAINSRRRHSSKSSQHRLHHACCMRTQGTQASALLLTRLTGALLWPPAARCGHRSTLWRHKRAQQRWTLLCTHRRSSFAATNRPSRAHTRGRCKERKTLCTRICGHSSGAHCCRRAAGVPLQRPAARPSTPAVAQPQAAPPRPARASAAARACQQARQQARQLRGASSPSPAAWPPPTPWALRRRAAPRPAALLLQQAHKHGYAACGALAATPQQVRSPLLAEQPRRPAAARIACASCRPALPRQGGCWRLMCTEQTAALLPKRCAGTLNAGRLQLYLPQACNREKPREPCLVFLMPLLGHEGRYKVTTSEQGAGVSDQTPRGCTRSGCTSPRAERASIVQRLDSLERELPLPPSTAIDTCFPAHASPPPRQAGSKGERPVMQFPFPEPSTSSQTCSPRCCTIPQQPGSAHPQPLRPAAVCSCCNQQQRDPRQQQRSLRHPAAWRPSTSAPITPPTSSIGAFAAARGLLAPWELSAKMAASTELAPGLPPPAVVLVAERTD